MTMVDSAPAAPPRAKARRPFRWVIRGTILAVVGYLAGVLLTVAIRGGSPTDEVAVIFGYVFALIGWLAGQYLLIRQRWRSGARHRGGRRRGRRVIPAGSWRWR